MKISLTLIKRLPIILAIFLILSCSGVYAVWNYSTMQALDDQATLSVGFSFTSPEAWKQGLTEDQVANVNAFVGQASNKTSALYDVISWREDGAFLTPGNFTYVGTMGQNNKMNDFKSAYNLTDSKIVIDFAVDPMVMYITNENLSAYKNGGRIPNVYKVTFAVDSVGNYEVATVTKGSAPWMAYDQSNYWPSQTFDCFNYKQWTATV